MPFLFGAATTLTSRLTMKLCFPLLPFNLVSEHVTYLLSRNKIVSSELLAPGSGELDRLRHQALGDVHLVPFGLTAVHVRSDPLRTDGVDDAPEELAVGPAPEVHLLVR